MVVWCWLLVGPTAGKETAAKGGAYCSSLSFWLAFLPSFLPFFYFLPHR
jgi:hypothetical protein